MPTIEGAGVHIKRAFGFHQVPGIDPFLLFDEFHSADRTEYGSGFPRHPHRGIETITYIIEGGIRHEDSLGNKGLIEAGDVQWMTAGSGIVHQEMIPELLMEKGLKVRIICGDVNGVEGPVKEIVTDPEYLDVTVPPEEKFSHITLPGYTVFAYVIEGKGHFDEGREPCAFEIEGGRYLDAAEHCAIGPEYLVLYGDGDSIEVTAGDKGVRFLLISGKPIGEPVAWYGPIVMNTQEELRTAFEEYRKNIFIKS